MPYINQSMVDLKDTSVVLVRKGRLFWKLVNRSGPIPEHRPELGPCWLWTGGKVGKGYGSFRGLNQKTTSAHRFAWLLANGAIPDRMHVLHKCDNMLCVRAEHLFLGTNTVNVHDMIAKGRHSHGAQHGSLCNPPRGDGHVSRRKPELRPRGERHGRAKLTEAHVREIRALYAAGGITQRELAKRFNSNQASISCVINRKQWKSVA